MKTAIRAAALIGVAAFSFSAFAAPPVPRVKAKLLSFDGKLLTLQPLAASDAKPVTVILLAEARVMATAPAALSDVKEGAYAGAAVTMGKDGKLTARSVMLYPDALRGTGEGRFADGDRTLVNGTVMAAAAGSLSLHYRGAVLNGTVCEGRAPPPALASLLACSGDAVIAVATGAPVTTLKPGDSGLLQPGATLTVSMARNAQGDTVTAGVIVETPAQAPPDAPKDTSKDGPKDGPVAKPAAKP